MNFKELVKLEFEKCKQIVESPRVEIPVLNDTQDVVGYMKPITKNFREEMPEVAALMSQWRIENPTISTGNFKVTTERTMTWLDNLVIGRDDRLIFMLTDLDGRFVGHLGFTHANYDQETIDLDSVLRGVKDGYPGIMSFATKSLMAWGFKNLKLKNVELEVYSDNDSAVRFYQRLGFDIKTKLPLMKVTLEDEEKFEIAPEDYTGPIVKHFLCMNYKGEELRC